MKKETTSSHKKDAPGIAGGDMRVAVMCRTEEFCFCCYETGWEYGTPVKYYCNTEMCSNPEKDCMFVQNGGKRP